MSNEFGSGKNGGVVKATQSDVQIGDFSVAGLMLPNGSFRMSDADAARAIGDNPREFGNFRTRSSSMGEKQVIENVKPLPCKGSAIGKKVDKKDLNLCALARGRVQGLINPTPVDVSKPKQLALL